MTRASGDAGFVVLDQFGHNVKGPFVTRREAAEWLLRMNREGIRVETRLVFHIEERARGDAGFEDDGGFEDANDYYYISYWRGGATYTKRFTTLEEAVYFAYDQEDRGEISAEHVCKSNGEIAFKFRR